MHQRSRQQLIIKQRIHLGNYQSVFANSKGWNGSTRTSWEYACVPMKEEHLISTFAAAAFWISQELSARVLRRPVCRSEFYSIRNTCCRMEQSRLIHVGSNLSPAVEESPPPPPLLPVTLTVPASSSSNILPKLQNAAVAGSFSCLSTKALEYNFVGI